MRLNQCVAEAVYIRVVGRLVFVVVANRYSACNDGLGLVLHVYYPQRLNSSTYERIPAAGRLTRCVVSAQHPSLTPVCCANLAHLDNVPGHVMMMMMMMMQKEGVQMLQRHKWHVLGVYAVFETLLTKSPWTVPLVWGVALHVQRRLCLMRRTSLTC